MAEGEGKWGTTVGSLIDGEPKAKASGRIFPKAGVALIKYGDEFYALKLNGNEPANLENIHPDLDGVRYGSLHKESGVKLNEAEIGEPPFENLLEKLRGEYLFSACVEFSDVFLDPRGENAADVRYLVADAIERFLKKYPQLSLRFRNKLEKFLPPKNYDLDLMDIYNSFAEANKNKDEAIELTRPAGSFEKTFPLFSELLQFAAIVWQENRQFQDNILATNRAVRNIA